MKYCLLFWGFCCFTCSVIGQDTVHLDSLSQWSLTAVRAGQYDLCKTYAERLNKIYQEGNLTQDSLYGVNNLRAGQAMLFAQDNEAALPFYRNAQTYFSEDTLLRPILLIQTYLGIGLIYKRASALDSALINYHLSLELAEKAYGPFASQTESIYNNLGNTYRILGDFPAAITHHQAALKVRKQKYGGNHVRIGDSYNNIALTHQNLLEYSKAKIYYQAAINQFAADEKPRLYRSALANYNIADVYLELGDLASSLTYINKALPTMEEVGKTNIMTYWDMQELKANLLAGQADFEAAEKLLKRIIKNKAIILEPDHWNWNFTYKTAAAIYAKQGKYNIAADFLKKGLEVANKNFESTHPEIIKLYNLLAENAIEDNDFSAASVYVDEMETKLLSADNHHQILSQEQLANFYLRKSILLEALFEKNGDLADLNAAGEYIDKVLLTLNNIRKSTLEQQTRRFLVDQQGVVVNQAVSIFSKLYKHTGEKSHALSALNAVDQSKSSLLKDAVKSNQSIRFAALPPDVKSQELALQSSMEDMRMLLNAKESQANFSMDAYELKMAELNNFLQTLKKDYPQHYNFLYAQAPLDLGKIIRFTKEEDRIILEYYLQEETIICFKIDETGLDLVEIALEEFSIDKIEQLKESVANPNLSRFPNTQLYELYQLLIGSVFPEGIEDKHLIIVPDKTLFQIPFEMLVTSATENDYLLQKNSISYAYSLRLWQLQMNQHSTPTEFAFGGFAPNYERSYFRDSLEGEPLLALLRSERQRLPGALTAVAGIQKMVGGKSYLGDQATESQFKTTAEDFQVIHFSMHAISDVEDPLSSGLIFQPIDSTEDNQLTAKEIYRMNLSADLAVLGACNTGWGKLNASEGMKSLGYAFAYAGVPSNVISLWKVPDASTAVIMQAFYKHLKDGASKDQALQKAKKDYLAQIVDPAQSHPFYWAGFILNGNTLPIDFSSQAATKLYWFALFSLLFLAAWRYFK